MAAKEIIKLSPEEKMAKIQQASLSSNEICANNNNRKLGKAVLSVPFPTCVCNPEAPCYKLCYAKHGVQAFSNIQGAYYRNLRLYNEDPDDFFEQLYNKIKHSGLPKVRFFDSGDYPNIEFVERSVELAKKLPDVKFMAFTKKYSLVNEYLNNGGQFPDNYNIMFSAWDKSWDVPNPYNISVAYIKFKDEDITPDIPRNAFHCPGTSSSCSVCGACWNKRLKGVYFDEH